MLGGGYNNSLLQALALLKCFMESQDIDAEVKAKILKSAGEEYRKSLSPYEGMRLGDAQKSYLDQPAYSYQSIRYDDV